MGRCGGKVCGVGEVVADDMDEKKFDHNPVGPVPSPGVPASNANAGSGDPAYNSAPARPRAPRGDGISYQFPMKIGEWRHGRLLSRRAGEEVPEWFAPVSCEKWSHTHYG